MKPDVDRLPDDRDLPPADMAGPAPDRPLVLLAAALCLGIAFQQAVQFPWLVWTLAVSVALVLAGSVWWLGARKSWRTKPATVIKNIVRFFAVFSGWQGSGGLRQ